MLMKDLQDGIKLEYQTLRNEVLLRFQLGVQIFAGALAASAAIMVIGFTPPVKPLIFLVGALFDTMTLYYLIELQERIVFRINSYIRSFFEREETGLLWERRSRDQHDISKHYSIPFLGGNYQYTFCLLLIGVNIFLFGLFIDPHLIPNIRLFGYFIDPTLSLVLVGTLVFSLIVAHTFTVMNRYRRGWGGIYDEDWQQIKRREEAK